MDLQVDVSITGHDEAGFRLHWYVCDNGMEFASGDARIAACGSSVTWIDEEPPAGVVGLLLAEIDRKVQSAVRPECAG